MIAVSPSIRLLRHSSSLSWRHILRAQPCLVHRARDLLLFPTRYRCNEGFSGIAGGVHRWSGHCRCILSCQLWPSSSIANSAFRPKNISSKGRQQCASEQRQHSNSCRLLFDRSTTRWHDQNALVVPTLRGLGDARHLLR